MTKLVRGFQDIDELAWIHLVVIQQLNQIASNCGFELLFLPTVEEKTTFQKAVGAMSNISQKEFFYCYGQNATSLDQLVLRPELTTGIIRHLIQSKKIFSPKQHNLFTYGHCFRYERPQQGRYREFYQWNLEQINFQPPQIMQILVLLNSILHKFQITKRVVVEINYLSYEQLEQVKKEILKYQNDFSFCKICVQRFAKLSVYRILDCQDCQHFLKPLINLESFLTTKEKLQYQNYYQQFQSFLPSIKIVKNPTLTRGLDYYLGLVFEIKLLDYHWSKNTIIAGGAYQLNAFNLVLDHQKQGIGFAIGVDRLVQVLKTKDDDYLLQLKNKILPSIMIGYLASDQVIFAFQFQQSLLANDLGSIVLPKPFPFLELLQKAIKQKVQWLIVFGKEYQKEQKIVVRQIGLTKTNYQQHLLPFTEAITMLTKGKISNE